MGVSLFQSSLVTATDTILGDVMAISPPRHREREEITTRIDQSIGQLHCT